MSKHIDHSLDQDGERKMGGVKHTPNKVITWGEEDPDVNKQKDEIRASLAEAYDRFDIFNDEVLDADTSKRILLQLKEQIESGILKGKDPRALRRSIAPIFRRIADPQMILNILGPENIKAYLRVFEGTGFGYVFVVPVRNEDLIDYLTDECSQKDSSSDLLQQNPPKAFAINKEIAWLVQHPHLIENYLNQKPKGKWQEMIENMKNHFPAAAEIFEYLFYDVDHKRSATAMEAEWDRNGSDNKSAEMQDISLRNDLKKIEEIKTQHAIKGSQVSNIKNGKNGSSLPLAA